MCNRMRVDPDRRAEAAASQRAGGIQLTRAAGGIKGGAGNGCVTAPEDLFRSHMFAEHTSLRITWKIGRHHRDALARTVADPTGSRRIPRLQFFQAPAQTAGVQHRDGKRADAALRASHAAYEVPTAIACALGKRRIDYAQQKPVTGIQPALR